MDKKPILRMHSIGVGQRCTEVVSLRAAHGDISSEKPLNITAQAIAAECDSLKDMLLAKNAAYGNSALEPVRCFSHGSTVDQLLVRIDDKLSRIATVGIGDAGEDTLRDLVGYLVLLRVAMPIIP